MTPANRDRIRWQSQREVTWRLLRELAAKRLRFFRLGHARWPEDGTIAAAWDAMERRRASELWAENREARAMLDAMERKARHAA